MKNERRPYSEEEKLEAVKRELGYRRRVYERRVADGKMRQSKADHELGVFEAIQADYEGRAQNARLI